MFPLLFLQRKWCLFTEETSGNTIQKNYLKSSKIPLNKAALRPYPSWLSLLRICVSSKNMVLWPAFLHITKYPKHFSMPILMPWRLETRGSIIILCTYLDKSYACTQRKFQTRAEGIMKRKTSFLPSIPTKLVFLRQESKLGLFWNSMICGCGRAGCRRQVVSG